MCCHSLLQGIFLTQGSNLGLLHCRQIPYCLSQQRSHETNLNSTLKSRNITLPTKVCIIRTMVFPGVMYGCEIWTIKKAERWRTDAFKLVLEKALESPLDCKEIQPVNPKGNQSWIFIGRTDAEAPILRPSDEKRQLIRKDPDARKDRKQKKGTTEDEVAGWHHQLSEHEFEQAPWDSEGQGSLACCSPCGCRVGHD